jgi:hypothetical protein
MPYSIDNPIDGRGGAAHFAEQALKSALAALPPIDSFTAGHVPTTAGHATTPGVVLRWPDTDEGRAAAALFARLLWARPAPEGR